MKTANHPKNIMNIAPVYSTISTDVKCSHDWSVLHRSHRISDRSRETTDYPITLLAANPSAAGDGEMRRRASPAEGCAPGRAAGAREERHRGWDPGRLWWQPECAIYRRSAETTAARRASAGRDAATPTSRNTKYLETDWRSRTAKPESKIPKTRGRLGSPAATRVSSSRTAHPIPA